MPVPSFLRPARSTNPFTLVAGVLTIGGLAWVLHARTPGSNPSAREGAGPNACAPGEPCAPPAPGADTGVSSPVRPVVHARDVCPDAGYLCAPLTQADHVLVQHWTDFSGTVVVHVPPPPGETSADARRLQQAAEAGIRAWNGQPFPILVDERGTRPATFSVTWVRSLGAKKIGLANTQWSRAKGLRVISIQLVTRNPLDAQRLLDPRQVQLVAAHEMGHALGLGHSDSQRDVMYPTNTATSLSARDYRTMEALYGLKDGTEIVQ